MLFLNFTNLVLFTILPKGIRIGESLENEI